MGECQNALRDAGKAYPRTCAKCGLGPCKDGLSREQLIAKVAALDAAEARAVVKPLVWEQRDQVHPQFKAVSAIGTYYIERHKGGLFEWWSPAMRGKIEVKTLELAQAAAQADYEARILSALHPASPLSALAMRRAAEAIVRDHQIMNGHGTATLAPRREGAIDALPYADAIAKLPTTFTHSELLAAAAELAEVNALVSAATSAKLILAEYEPHPLPMLGGLLAALAPFARKAGV